jgi:hypothetical protein
MKYSFSASDNRRPYQDQTGLLVFFDLALQVADVQTITISPHTDPNFKKNGSIRLVLNPPRE